MGKVINGKTEEQINAERLEANETQIAAITNYTTVAAVDDTYTLDVGNSAVKNFRIETEDADAKEIEFSNVPTETEVLIELTYTNAAAITWPYGITWLSGSAPTFEAGKVYRILFFTVNIGTAWQAVSVGGW